MQNAQSGTLAASVETRPVATQIYWITGFALLTAVGAQVEIPHQPVPYTLQTMVVLLAGALLGARNGFLSQCLYLLAGAVGLPVFSGFGFGVARLLGPTGGFLLAFPVAALSIGYLAGIRPTLLRTLGAMAIGLAIIFSLGTLQLNFVYFHDWRASLSSGLLIFSWWDCLKLASAAAIARVIQRRAPRLGR